MGILARIGNRLRWIGEASQIRRGRVENRHWVDRGIDSAEHYWDNREDPNNAFLYGALDVVPFTSVLEIGSNCGNRLFQLARDRRETKCIGIDVNTSAIEFGQRQFSALGISNVELIPAGAEELPAWEPASVDVVFSWATLIYIHPKDILDVLASAVRVARQAVVLLEIDDPTIRRPKAQLGRLVPPRNWVRNYRAILRRVASDSPRVSVSPIPHDVWNPGGGPGSVITLTKPQKPPTP